MELKIDIDYTQILRLIRQLPVTDLKRLTGTLQSELSVLKTSGTLQQIILNAPTWSDADLNECHEAREYLNKSRIA